MNRRIASENERDAQPVPYGLYIHWPFCRSKCPYCGFVSVPAASQPDSEHLFGRYAEAVRRELAARRTGVFAGEPATIYLGGGTPSLIPAKFIRPVLADVSDTSGVECTVEANPDSLSEPWLESLREAGVNRVSIGVQALDDRLLANLGRIHRADRAEWAVGAARRCGFENVSIDLMFGIPDQTAEDWERTLRRAVEPEPDHISAYSLGVEEDTPYFEQARRGGLNIPDAGETASMYSILVETLRNHGYSRYEISNFARPGRECRHNIGYWDFTPYLGIGASAHSFDGWRRRWNEGGLERYLDRVESGEDPAAEYEEPDAEARALEELMLSLRRDEGLDLERFFRKYPGARPGMSARIAGFERDGLLAVRPGERLVLTGRGVMLADEILAELALTLESASLEQTGRRNV